MLDRQVIEYVNFGHIKIKLDKIMKQKDITTYELSNKANLKFQTVQNLRNSGKVSRINFDVLAKLCYVLQCKVEDLIEYVEK